MKRSMTFNLTMTLCCVIVLQYGWAIELGAKVRNMTSNSRLFLIHVIVSMHALSFLLALAFLCVKNLGNENGTGYKHGKS